MTDDQPEQGRSDEIAPLDELMAVLRVLYHPDEFMPNRWACEEIAERLYAKYQHVLDPRHENDDDDVADARWEALDQLVNVVRGQAS